MKIFMVIKKLHYSGAVRMFLWLAKTLNNQGHDVKIFTYLKGMDNTIEIPNNIVWIRKEMDSSSLFSIGIAIRSEIKKWDPDCSISFLLDANILNIFACKWLRTKSIVCERNDPFKPRYYKLKVSYPFFRWADGAVFQLDQVRSYYKNIKGLTAVIPNPVVHKEFVELRPFDERENIIITLSRLDLFQKRQDVLIRAFGKFSKIHTDYILKIYGDGPDDQKRIEKLIADMHLQEKVILCGVTDYPKEALKEAKFFVLTSDFEGIPNALIEAMSIGLPCISTDCSPGGAALLIQNGENGYLVPKGDVETICNKMLNLVADPKKADAIGRKAATIIETYSETKIADFWENYLKAMHLTV